MIDTVERAFELADKYNLSLFKLCETSGINYSTIASTRRRGGQLNVVTIGTLCEAMDISMSEFFEDSEEGEHL